MTEKEIRKALAQDDFAGLIAGVEPITRKVLENSGSLKVISRVGTGLDNVDLEATRRLGIKVYNTPSAPVDSVAELTVGLILSALRKIVHLDRCLRTTGWRKESGVLLKGRTLGIVGFGRIGKRVARLARAFDARILFYDVRKLAARGARQVSLSDLLRKSDIISVHVGGHEKIIGAKEISKLKKGCVLINTSRGGVIDEEALYQGLMNGRVGYAGLDVYSEEPYKGKLLKLDNTVLTPHVGSYAREARIAMERQAVNNLLKGLKGSEKR